MQPVLSLLLDVPNPQGLQEGELLVALKVSLSQAEQTEDPSTLFDRHVSCFR